MSSPVQTSTLRDTTSQCPEAKAVTRRLEKVYRRDKNDTNREAWRRQYRLLRQTLKIRRILVRSNCSQSQRFQSAVFEDQHAAQDTPVSYVRNSHSR